MAYVAIKKVKKVTATEQVDRGELFSEAKFFFLYERPLKLTSVQNLVTSKFDLIERQARKYIGICHFRNPVEVFVLVKKARIKLNTINLHDECTPSERCLVVHPSTEYLGVLRAW